MTAIAPDVQRQCSSLAPLLTIHSEQDYDASIVRLNALIDEVGTDESHPLYTLLDTLGLVIQAYEEQHHTIPDTSSAEVLSYLIKEPALSEADLPEVGPQSTVAAILSGDEALTIQQVRALATRFKVSPSVFI